MATIVCQGLQSCLESQLVESTTTWRLKLSSPKTHFFPQPLELALKSCSPEHNTTTNKEVGQKFQASNGTTTTTTQKEKPSFLAQIKSTICDKSLELCTENLGSDSGTDITEEDTIIFTMSSSSDSKAGYCPAREQEKPGRRWGCRRGNSRSFPPPLTTMTGSESLRVRPRREDGRLMIEAVEAPSIHTLFQAERSHGRLRLTLLEDSCSSSDYLNDADSEENEDDNELVADDGGVEEEEEEMDGNKINVGDELGSGRINQRPSRCKEGEQEKENGLLNLESYWVASSS